MGSIEKLAALLVVILLSPIIIAVAIACFANGGLPIIFKQRRPGHRGNIFIIYKFRTMDVARTDDLLYSNDEIRMTTLGKFLRKTSLDELPQLWNIIMGHMSFVGPRPLLEDYLPLYTKEQMRRHDVKPGITGWAQVNGRNSVAWEDKFELDIWYVENKGLLLDLKIIGKTILNLLTPAKVTSNGFSTSVKFRGDFRNKLD